MPETKKIKKHNMFNAKNLAGKMVKHQNQMDKQMETLFGKEHKESKRKKKKSGLSKLLGF